MADRAAAAVVVVLCVVALALTASTLSPTSSNQRGAGEGERVGADDDPLGQQTPTNQSAPDAPGLPGDLVAILVAVAVVLAIPGALLMGYDRALGIAAAVVLFAGLLGLYFLLSGTIDAPLPGGDIPNASGSPFGGGGDMGSADESAADNARDLPSLVTFGVVGFALLAALGLIYYASASVDASVDPSPPPEPDSPDREAVGAAAARAAERIDDHEGDAENAVYEAWVEMTTALAVPDPATSTPGEFADAATAAGMDEARVAELTDLFERVRYGSEPVTADHERQAVETLRAIQAAHEGVDADSVVAAADAESDGGSPVGDGPGDEAGATETGGDAPDESGDRT
ncbi:DUF4129 domain-containing protein [Halosimplex pelagicum]|uniref:DUF4129 domain-containing protein n=1 Tax=Halosimplex pelagicum TaxID=869886 RepID=A0A7D5T9D0_9EURY|nr:DUF4129 domain-containing protein [Halosimplex pelagicum]QLH81770.1 DUF4129 domain-containing protein [Halosimplex pelagicum]